MNQIQVILYLVEIVFGVLMKKIVRSPGSATIVNAIATGEGSAFGINLDIIVKAESTDFGIKCNPDIDVDTTLMELSCKNVLDYYGIDFDDKNFPSMGVKISTETNLPKSSGLSSSSALSNAVTLAVSELVCSEFDRNPLTDMEIINLAIDSSLEAGVTITGAYDDATASYFGGVTVTNNLNREILIKEKMPNHKLLIYMPNIISMTANSDVERMKLLAPLVAMAFEKACQKQYYTALNLNGILYSNALGFDTKLAIDALEAGATAAGLSGTGSAYVAIIDTDSKDKVKDIWNSYTDSGRIIETEVDNLGTKVIS